MRRRVDVQGPPGRRRRGRSPRGRSTRASSSRPARAACSRPHREDWADRARHLREHAMSVSAADRHASVLAPAGGVRRGRLQLPDDRPAGGRRARAARPAARDRRAAPRDRGALPGGDRRHRRAAGGRRPRVRHGQLPVVLGRGARRVPDRPRRPARGARATPTSRRGAASWPRTASRRTATSRPEAGLPVTERLNDRTLILPVFHTLTDADQERVIAVLRAPGGASA